MTDPARTLSTPWNAGFIRIEWVTDDFTKCEFQQNQVKACSKLERFRSKAYFSVPAGSVMTILCNNEVKIHKITAISRYSQILDIQLPFLYSQPVPKRVLININE